MSQEKAIKKISEILNNKNYDNILDLNLDRCFQSKIPETIKSELEKFTNLEILRLNDCGLSTLQNLPQIPSLLRIELNKNSFNLEDLSNLFIYPNLISISLSSNILFENLDYLSIYKDLFKNIRQLDFFNCPMANKKNYRKKIFSLFPDLVLLDNLDKNGQEVILSENSVNLSEESDSESNSYIDDEEIKEPEKKRVKK